MTTLLKLIKKIEKEKEKKEKSLKVALAKEIFMYPVYLLTARGRLVEIPLCSLNEYNHNRMHLHHYLPRSGSYYKVEGRQWYIDNDIKQKLILLPIPIHEQVHQQAVKNLSDDMFLFNYGLKRSDLLFTRKDGVW